MFPSLSSWAVAEEKPCDREWTQDAFLLLGAGLLQEQWASVSHFTPVEEVRVRGPPYCAVKTEWVFLLACLFCGLLMLFGDRCVLLVTLLHHGIAGKPLLKTVAHLPHSKDSTTRFLMVDAQGDLLR